MKDLIAFILLSFSLFTPLHAQLIWKGDVNCFVTEKNGISLSAPEEVSTAMVFSSCKAIDDAQWLFEVNLKFNPSSSNFIRIYPVAKIFNNFPQDGYFLEFGRVEDKVTFNLLQNEHIKELAATPMNFLNNSENNISVKINRYTLGDWIIILENAGNSDTLKIRDSTFYVNSAIIISAFFTKTRRDKMSVNNISFSGNAFVDILPPSLDSIYAIDPNTLKLFFSEPIATAECKFLDNTVIDYEGFGTKELSITVEDEFKTGQQTYVELYGVIDTAGNVMKNSSYLFDFEKFKLRRQVWKDSRIIQLEFSEILSAIQENILIEILDLTVLETKILGNKLLIYFAETPPDDKDISLDIRGLMDNRGGLNNIRVLLTKNRIKRFDLIINEVMSDPSPSVKLPEIEFVEIYNNSNYEISLSGATIIVNNTKKNLPDFSISPNGYLVLANDCSGFNKERCLKCALPSVPNNVAQIILADASGHVIDGVWLSSSFYKSAFKKAGGWSLERIDAGCSALFNNWNNSNDERGGTPGYKNFELQEFLENIPPICYNSYLIADSVLILNFDEYIMPENFDIRYNGQTLSKVVVIPDRALGAHVKIILPPEFRVSESATFEFRVEDRYRNCRSFKKNFFPVSEPESKDLIFSEVMFAPDEGSQEYIEVYNNSDKALDLSKILLVKMSEGVLEEGVALSDSVLIIRPKEVLICASDSVSFRKHYLMNFNLKITNALDDIILNNESGFYCLVTPSGKIIDEMNYSDGLHSPLIGDSKGVSLSREIFENSSLVYNNWYSTVWNGCSFSPGYVDFKTVGSSDEVLLVNDIISPNGDGFDDFLEINLNIGKNIFAQVSICDLNGRVVFRVCRSQLVGPGTKLYWYGISENGMKVSPGAYLLYVRLFDNNKVKEYRKAIAVSW